MPSVDGGVRSRLAGVASFGAALLASAHHWLHALLAAFGFTLLLPFADPAWRFALLALSLGSTLVIIAWLLRMRDAPPARFWGLGASACLSLALVAFTVAHDGL